MAVIEGYNIALKINSKTLLGRTKEDFNLSAVTKSSITKDDNGNPAERVTGHEATFAVTALFSLDSTGTKHDRDDILALAMAVGTNAVIPFSYEAGSGTDVGKTLSGNCVITSYSESSSADGDSTVTVNLKTTGTLTLT